MVLVYVICFCIYNICVCARGIRGIGERTKRVCEPVLHARRKGRDGIDLRLKSPLEGYRRANVRVRVYMSLVQMSEFNPLATPMDIREAGNLLSATNKL